MKPQPTTGLATSGTDADVPETDSRGVLTIDLGAIVANWRDLAARAAPAECAAVVKADAYGCGIEPVVDALGRAGCRTFFVAHLSEARRARAVAPPGAIVYVLNGLAPDSAPAFAADDLRPILSCREEVAEWASFRAASGWSGLAAVQVDTGMGRLGLSSGEAGDLAVDGTTLAGAGIGLILSHLACADDPGHPLNARQMAHFRGLAGLYPGIPASLANSSGIFLGPDARHGLVRPGAALYGVNPTPAHANPMRPVVRLEGRVVQVRTMEEGDTVGYGAVWTARRRSRIALLAIGYADGFPRAAGGSDLRPGADVMVGGRRCPLAGRVSMDLLAVDVTALPPTIPRRGDPVVILGDDIGVDELAAHAGTIGYEVLTRLGHRYRRIHVPCAIGDEPPLLNRP